MLASRRGFQKAAYTRTAMRNMRRPACVIAGSPRLPGRTVVLERPSRRRGHAPGRGVVAGGLDETATRGGILQQPTEHLPEVMRVVAARQCYARAARGELAQWRDIRREHGPTL